MLKAHNEMARPRRVFGKYAAVLCFSSDGKMRPCVRVCVCPALNVIIGLLVLHFVGCAKLWRICLDLTSEH